jgi:hypothetical protein
MKRIAPVNCYAEFNEKSSIVIDYCHKLVETDSPWYPYIGWEVKVVPREIFLEEPLLNMINQKFPINRAAILRTEPYQNYHWHVDQYRGVCVNMLVTPDVRSYCLFGKQKNENNVYFTELNYEKNSFYLFNNQFPHSVINFDQHRYLFSIEFVDHKSNLSYATIYKWCRDVGLLK